MSPSHRLRQDDMVAAQQHTDALALGSAAALARGTLVVRLMHRVARRPPKKQMALASFFPAPLDLRGERLNCKVVRKQRTRF